MNLISGISKEEYDMVVDLWEASVRATHHFLSEEDILFYKPLIRDYYLDMVRLYSARDEFNQITGFMGVVGNNVEMLFVHPETRGMGIGKYLLNYGISRLGISKVEVNEQNREAIGFYLRMGFKIIGRSELDGQGKPYPILHMELKPDSNI